MSVIVFLTTGWFPLSFERLHEKTSSFHIPMGEMWVTLDDVSYLLHLPIEGTLLDHDGSPARPVYDIISSIFCQSFFMHFFSWIHCNYGELEARKYINQGSTRSLNRATISSLISPIWFDNLRAPILQERAMNIWYMIISSHNFNRSGTDF